MHLDKDFIEYAETDVHELGLPFTFLDAFHNECNRGLAIGLNS